MKTSILDRKSISPEVVALISRLVALIPWPARRQAMGDVAVTLLEGRERVAEAIFGWGRSGVAVGIHEFQRGIVCVNDVSPRHRPKSEDKAPELLADIQTVLEPQSQADPRLRTTLLHTNMTAQAVHAALVARGWTDDSLPTVRTISNILNRQAYRLRTVAKTKVQKKRQQPTPSSPTSV